MTLVSDSVFNAEFEEQNSYGSGFIYSTSKSCGEIEKLVQEHSSLSLDGSHGKAQYHWRQFEPPIIIDMRR